MALLGLQESDITDDYRSSVANETWLCLWDEVYPNYTLSYPALGVAHSAMTNLICTQIKVNPEGQYIDGEHVAKLTASFRADYDYCADVFSLKISAGGYRTFKIYAGGTWYALTMKGSLEQGELEYKLPITNLSLSTRVFGEVDYTIYQAMVGAINATTFYQRPRGTVLFDNYSITPKIVNGVTQETDLTLDFKMCTLDWNYEYRNPMQFINSFDNKPAFWQNQYSSRFDYTTDATKVGQPIWSGEISGYGSAALGVGAWDFRTFNMTDWDPGTNAWVTTARCVYTYAELNTLIGVTV